MDVGRDDDPPVEIAWFHFLWLGGMIAGAAYDLCVAMPGDFREATLDVLAFATAAALLFCATRLRSNTARMLLVPFVVVTVVEVFSHEMAMASGHLASILMVVQLLA